MRKQDKKLDKQLRRVLTEVCETALKDTDGFKWLTHTVNYSRFPSSLKVVCVFDSNDQLLSFGESKRKNSLSCLIQIKLESIGVKFKNVSKHVVYDTEENCAKLNDGNWASRLA